MATIEEILAQIGTIDPNRDAAIQQSNPYAQWKAIPSTLGQLALQNPSAGIKEQIIAGMLTGIAKGGLQQYENNYQDEASKEYDQVKAAAVTGSQIPKTSYLQPNVFRQAQQEGVFARNLVLAEDAKTKKESKAKKDDLINKRFLDNGFVINDNGEASYNEILDKNAQAKKLFEEQQIIKNQYKTSGGSNPYVGKATWSELAKKYGLVKVAKNLIPEIPNNVNLLEWQASRLAQGLDDTLIQSNLKQIASQYLLATSGKASNEAERKDVQKIVNGDFSVNSEVVKKLLRNFVNVQSSLAMGEMDALESLAQGGPDALRKNFSNLVETNPLSNATINPSPNANVQINGNIKIRKAQ